MEWVDAMLDRLPGLHDNDCVRRRPAWRSPVAASAIIALSLGTVCSESRETESARYICGSVDLAPGEIFPREGRFLSAAGGRARVTFACDVLLELVFALDVGVSGKYIRMIFGRKMIRMPEDIV